MCLIHLHPAAGRSLLYFLFSFFLFFCYIFLRLLFFCLRAAPAIVFGDSSRRVTVQHPTPAGLSPSNPGLVPGTAAAGCRGGGIARAPPA